MAEKTFSTIQHNVKTVEGKTSNYGGWRGKLAKIFVQGIDKIYHSIQAYDQGVARGFLGSKNVPKCDFVLSLEIEHSSSFLHYLQHLSERITNHIIQCILNITCRSIS